MEGLVRAGRVTIDGRLVTHPSEPVAPGESVEVDGRAVLAPPDGGVAYHRAVGAPLALAHPPELHVVAPLPADRGGLELLLADEALARRLGDPRHPIVERLRDGVRVRIGAVELGDLPVGAWRPLAPREVARLRLGARLPPTAR